MADTPKKKRIKLSDLKIDYSRKDNLEGFIEDNIDNLTKSCCERICIDYPYNRDANKDWAYDIYRVHNWKEVVKTVNEIERKMKEWEK